MKRKRASEIFGPVDPGLTVINGGRRRKRDGRPAYKPRPVTEDEWGKATGVNCNGCGRETLRVIEGLCPECSRAVETETEERLEKKAMRNYYMDKVRKGTLNLSRMRQGLL